MMTRSLLVPLVTALFIVTAAGDAFKAVPGTTCGVHDPKSRSARSTRVRRVTGGFDAHAEAFPWYAFFKPTQPSGYGSTCGSAIISDRWAVTAAHCFTYGEPTTVDIKQSYILVGGVTSSVYVNDNTWGDQTKYMLSDFVIHPGWLRVNVFQTNFVLIL